MQILTFPQSFIMFHNVSLLKINGSFVVVKILNTNYLNFILIAKVYIMYIVGPF